jgi:hypothetical protein
MTDTGRNIPLGFIANAKQPFNGVKFDPLMSESHRISNSNTQNGIPLKYIISTLIDLVITHRVMCDVCIFIL